VAWTPGLIVLAWLLWHAKASSQRAWWTERSSPIGLSRLAKGDLASLHQPICGQLGAASSTMVDPSTSPGGGSTHTWPAQLAARDVTPPRQRMPHVGNDDERVVEQRFKAQPRVIVRAV
jgi:hypothetical protein